MIDGRMEKFFTEVALLEQPFVKDQTLTVNDLVKQLSAKTGEKISVRRFTRYKMGEGLEKRSEDFAAEIASMTK
jgi:elongation factor Ts